MDDYTTLTTKRRRQGCSIAMLVVFLLCSFCEISLAASRSDQEEQNNRSRQEAQKRARQEQQKDVFLQQGTAETREDSLPEETPSFLIQKIRIVGDNSGRFSWLARQAGHYNNRRIGKQGLDMIVKRLENALIDRGFVTSRLLVPEQNLSDGVLTLRLVTGYVGEIRFASPVDRANWQSAFPCRTGDVLNLRELEQGLEQLKRLPSQDASFQLVPGQALGLSDIVINLKRNRQDRTVLSLDDSGNQATGRLQSSFSYGVDNLLGKHDLFQFSYNTDAEKSDSEKGTGGTSFYWSMPDGWWTYSLAHWSSRYKQTIPIFGASIEYTGRNETWEAEVERLLHRDKNSKTSLNLTLQRNCGHSYINDIDIANQRKKTSALAIGLRQRRYIGQEVWNLQAAYRHGLDWFDAQDDSRISDNYYTSRYGMWTAEVDLDRPVSLFGAAGRYTGIVKGQYTNSPLYGNEYFSIGNRYTVRGFDGEETLMGENGWYWRNEFSFAIGKHNKEIYYGVDYGRVSGQKAAALSGEALLGAVVGLRTPVGAAGKLDVFIGWPLQAPDEMNSDNPTIGFQCSWQL